MAFVVGLPGMASAGPVDANPALRFNVTALGDGLFFEAIGDEIPAAPANSGGSPSAYAEATNSGGSKAYAGAPYFGNTVQFSPGLVNGLVGQFGLGEVGKSVPIAAVPGYVETGSTSFKQKDVFDGGLLRAQAESSDPAKASSSASYGLPDAPGSGTVQSANAVVEAEGKKVVGSAAGSTTGLVVGPLEVINSTAAASVSQAAGRQSRITSKVFGRFKVADMEFGFDQKGFRFLGQGVSNEDALSQANAILKAANVQIGIAGIESVVDASGVTKYVIGALEVRTQQDSPTGAPGAKFILKLVLGQATVTTDAADLSASSDGAVESGSDGAAESGSRGSDVSGIADDRSVKDSTSATTSALDDVIAPEVADQSAAVPVTVSEVTSAGKVTELAPEASGEVSPFGDDTVVAEEALPRTLGFVPLAGETGDGTEWLYAMLLLAGVGVLGGHFLFGRFAAARGA
ncbi:MAG: hypothetical protein ACT4P1_10040 [Sporichthyaceae bacterium]